MVGTSLRSFAHPTHSVILRSIAEAMRLEGWSHRQSQRLPRLAPPVLLGGASHRFGQRTAALLLRLFR